MRNDIEHKSYSDSERLAILETRAKELERMLLGMGDATGVSAHPLAGADFAGQGSNVRTEALISHGRQSARRGRRAGAAGFGDGRSSDQWRSASGVRLSRGAPGSVRPAPRRRGFMRSHWRGLLTAVVAVAAAVAVAAGVLSRGGPGWPPSVAVVRSEVTVACQNPDVASEPGQVNFACTSDTQQVLWVFALLTSGDNPSYVDQTTGRRGLEPIAPTQGGDIAWSVNLHHPYDPLNPVDSLTVAARAIDNIIGGATLTSANGAPSVQPGLESSAANCVRYTGSAALRTRSGYPATCARPIRTVAGQEDLVSDVFRKWMASAPAASATEAGVLFANANDPGNPQVQAILGKLPGFGM
jgi:hypothetical protein